MKKHLRFVCPNNDMIITSRAMIEGRIIAIYIAKAFGD